MNKLRFEQRNREKAHTIPHGLPMVALTLAYQGFTQRLSRSRETQEYMLRANADTSPEPLRATAILGQN